MTLQEVIDTRDPAYLKYIIETLLLLNEIKRLNEAQWLAVHYMQFCVLLAIDRE